MSVQQVKKQFEEFAAYLGRDVTGLEKLRKLKDAVNVLRTSLASAQEQATGCAATRQVALERALNAEADLQNARLEIHSLRQQVANLTRDLKVATKVDTEEQEVDEPSYGSESDTQAIVTKVIKRVRKQMRYCPEAKSVNHVRSNNSRDKNNRWVAFDRDALAEGWSHESLWRLGASVALLSGFFGEVRIETDKRVQEFIKEDREHEGFGKHMIQWIAKHFSRELGMEKVPGSAPKYYEVELEQENLNAALSRGYEMR